ncbi:hypothetical protein [Vibrio rotiferianus]|uniref:hypothetical protein n=1 Tax=Vibrio rotiferianus TaxID=190895 RepID=UPI001587D68E|nr:hypothetical protein [Vibrio rotiferianus]
MTILLTILRSAGLVSKVEKRREEQQLYLSAEINFLVGLIEVCRGVLGSLTTRYLAIP